jgi:hypothetical protein
MHSEAAMEAALTELLALLGAPHRARNPFEPVGIKVEKTQAAVAEAEHEKLHAKTDRFQVELGS